MNDDTIRMARESKLDIYGLGCPHDQFIEKVKAFEDLARADEREACAKVCDNHATKDGFEGCYANACAESIRARGNT
jgi:hypothetical protein